jgi:hypothetical protein
MSNKTNATSGEELNKNYPTEPQIKEWKKLYGGVSELTIQGDEGENVVYKAWLKKPDRKIVALASTKQNDPIKMGEVILTNCWLMGDDEIKTNDDLFLSAISQLNQLIVVKAAELKKL